ncbi:MAG TPA: flagellar hook-basal body complex protein FliE [Dongiaceae bacterium]|nr:flagellar hook-basal body complex protein FliE [Dongiaceae bacterium]
MNGISSVRILPADSEPTSLGPSTTNEPGFRDVLHGAINDIRELESQAQAQVAGVLEGNGADVHSALIAVEKADLSFQLMMQVRNKIVSAYEEISRMQF